MRNVSHAVTELLESPQQCSEAWESPRHTTQETSLNPAGCFVKSMLHFPPSNKKEQRSAENIAGCVVQPLAMLLQEVGNATNFSPGENILEKGFIQSW